MALSCRYYEKKYPETDEVVMVNVRSIADMGAYVHLLEYNNIEGMILLSELSRRRIRSINKLIRVGRTEPVVVIRVDKCKGYIDLSKRRVCPEDIEQCTETFSKAKAVNSILRHVATLLEYKTDEELEELYKKTAWHFEAKSNKKGSSYDYFKQAVVDPSLLDECDLDEHTKKILFENIEQKLTQQAVKIRADVEVACYHYEGIDAIKEALRAGMACSNETVPIKINLIAPPLYVITTSTPEKVEGLELMQKACEAIKDKISEYGGSFNIQMAPKVVTATDEEDLAKQLERAERENAEVSGDEDEDEEVGMGGGKGIEEDSEEEEGEEDKEDKEDKDEE
eukprot:TRINITY_DN912_c0_g1_i1.p1 TRINITY_DN912_c0_g1~~TRINITY_DN912_c0_g1_i1.p1  ORF type:complete len:353 (+),score=152.83 TRINITY_DN912_c0_g1_i1:43-1059(+)